MFEFQCLPFGLCTAPYVLTKLLRPTVKLLREKDLFSVFYLDDALLLRQNKENCRNNIRESIRLLESLGLIVNKEKSCLTPTQELTFLGFPFNTKKYDYALNRRQKIKIEKIIREITTKNKIKTRDSSKFLETLISICSASKYGWLYTKRFERIKHLALKDSNYDYDKKNAYTPQPKK